MKNHISIVCIALMLVACADSDTPKFATAQFKVEAPSGCEVTEGLALSDYSACGFKISVLGGFWDEKQPGAVFESGCLSYTGDLVTVRNLPVGDDLTVYVQVFSDTSCSDLIVKGARGGVQVVEEEDAIQGIWYVPTFQVGGFKGLPVFSQDKRTLASETDCSKDADCRATDVDGNFTISPIAFCNADKKCELPGSLFPLNMSSPRAFHTATRIADGRIAFVGGLGEPHEEGVYSATETTLELFDPVTLTWSKPEIKGFSGIRVAMHSAVSLGGSRLGIFGGAKQINVSRPGTIVNMDFPAEADKVGGDNLSDNVFAVDLDNRASAVGTLTRARVAMDAARVLSKTQPRVLVSGGAHTVENNVVRAVHTDVCDLNGETPVCTAPNEPLNGARSGHCGVCLDDNDNADCSKYMVFGGLAATETYNDIIGELFQDGKFTPVAWGAGSLDGNILEPKCLRSENQFYLTGGVSKFGTAPNIVPQKLLLQSPYAQVQAAEFKEAEAIPDATRTHHSATAMSGGKVLVAGGIGADGAALSSAYIAEGRTVVAKLTMSTPRFGHTATVIDSGPLKGSVLIAGGLTVDDQGQISLVEGAELFVP